MVSFGVSIATAKTEINHFIGLGFIYIFMAEILNNFFCLILKAEAHKSFRKYFWFRREIAQNKIPVRCTNSGLYLV